MFILLTIISKKTFAKNEKKKKNYVNKEQKNGKTLIVQTKDYLSGRFTLKLQSKFNALPHIKIKNNMIE